MVAFPEARSYSRTVSVRDTARLQCGDNKTVVTPVNWLYQPSPRAKDYVIISAGHLINSDFEGRLDISGSTLIINNVKKDDNGAYTCAENAGHGRRHRIHLNVEGKYFHAAYPKSKQVRHREV